MIVDKSVTGLDAEANQSQFKAKAKNGSAWKQATCGREPNFFTISSRHFVEPGARYRETRKHEADYVPSPASDFALNLARYG